ncbi:MAG: branched-chain amino acid ABC transporter permease [Nitrososphaerales archaeon]
MGIKTYISSIPILLLLIALPHFLSSYMIHLAIISYYYVILAVCWNLLAGYTGQFSLAQHAFAAIGAYTAALLAVHLNIHPIFGIASGGLVATGWSLLIGRLVLKMRAIYLALATWAFAESSRLFIAMEYEWTRGDLGLPIPFNMMLYGPKALTPYHYYYTMLIMMVSILLIIYKIINSKIGLFARSIREDEVAARMMGVDVVKVKLFIFSITGLFSGLAGGLYAHYMGLLSPSLISFYEMAIIIIMVIIGGFGTFWGPIIGAPFIYILSEMTRAYGEIRMVVFAAVVIIIIRFFNRGLTGLPLLFKRLLPILRPR